MKQFNTVLIEEHEENLLTNIKKGYYRTQNVKGKDFSKNFDRACTCKLQSRKEEE